MFYKIYGKGPFFVQFPKDLAKKLPGKTLLTEDFFKKIKIIDKNGRYKKKLEGAELGTRKKPVLDYESKYFSLKVVHGSGNKKAEKISQLATKELTDQKIRSLYQQQVFKLIKPVLAFSDAPLRIIEDCLASGDTLAGLLSLLKKKTILKPQKVRIDVLVATTLGIEILIDFAKKNRIDLELVIGYLAYGLSEKNYIVYPNHKKYQYVVGDMGDAAKSLEKKYNKVFPWNRWRRDKLQENKFDPKKGTILYLANGGYLMQAIMKELFDKRDCNEIMLCGKRRWDKKKGYGVFIDWFPKNLLKKFY